MTTEKHVVAYDILGRISRKVLELIRRIGEGSASPSRAQALLQLAIEGIPEPHDEGSSWGTYVLESRWAWDNSHTEYVTLGLEKCDSPAPFEDLLNPLAPDEDKMNLLMALKAIYAAQIPQHGSHKMLRLYRVVRRQYHGYDPGIGLNGTLQQNAVDIHWVLKPICEFDDGDEPIACRITGQA